MALTNRDRVGRVLELMREGTIPFAEQQFQAHLGKNWSNDVQQCVNTKLRVGKDGIEWDTYSLLRAIDATWGQVFGKVLDKTHRAWINEILAARNSWAHDEAFGSDDTDRVIDTVQRFLQAISAGDQASAVSKIKMDLRRLIFSEQARSVKRAVAKLDGTPESGLKAWREIVTPHMDVSSGNYLKAEFAADLAQVYRGDASAEYGQPTEFFSRTHLTGGLVDLLKNALKRIVNNEGEPVIELQTNFGGGKTHSMLSLYHLFGGCNPTTLAGIEPILRELSISKLPEVSQAVLVGTAFGPGQVVHKDKGITIHTLWGELAWQLGNCSNRAGEAYSIVAQSDRNGTNPGSDILVKLFKEFCPSLILIDEWVAYIRQTYGVKGLPGGSFEANLSFVQSLTEAVKASPNCLLVASLPVSNTETGGEGGRRALDALKHTFHRVESSWRPASQEESYEIIRRRLFEPLSDREFAERDAVLKAFVSQYKGNDFPSECRELSYQQRMESCYPIHPELFELLYGKWSALDKFQQTRGVLRMMASVIYSLWIGQDSNLLIMPSSIPIDDRTVCDGLTYYLDDGWKAVIDLDIDGGNAVSRMIDRENPSLGRYSACRRVARTIFLASAPSGPNPGLDDKRISLACSQPGESISTFGDGLRRLVDRATYLYQDSGRYWYSTQPSVSRLAQDRAKQVLADDEALNSRLLDLLRVEANKSNRGDFSSVHLFFDVTDDLADEREARMIILGPDYPHLKNTSDSEALDIAREILEKKGSSPRLYKNTLVFLAADKSKVNELKEAVAELLAWESICKDVEKLNLAPSQAKQAEARFRDAESTVDIRIRESWVWCLIPEQEVEEIGSLQWVEKKIQGDERLAIRVSKKLRAEEDIFVEYGSERLKLDLEKFNLFKENNDMTVRELCEYYATYPYLPRLRDSECVISAVEKAFTGKLFCDGFAYAVGQDDKTKKYLGLVISDGVPFTVHPSGLVVKASIALKQAGDDRKEEKEEKDKSKTSIAGRKGGGGVSSKKIIKRFYASIPLDENRIGRDSSRIAQEVVERILDYGDASIKVVMDIEVDFAEGASDELILVVTENCKALNIESFGFEEE